MKNIFGFNQAWIIKLELDPTDLVLLDWFLVHYTHMTKATFDGREFAWVPYAKLLEDLPSLNLSKDRVYRRFKAYVKKGILFHHHSKQGGSYSFYAKNDYMVKEIKRVA
jgi:hypothetical protein